MNCIRAQISPTQDEQYGDRLSVFVVAGEEALAQCLRMARVGLHHADDPLDDSGRIEITEQPRHLPADPSVGVGEGLIQPAGNLIGRILGAAARERQFVGSQDGELLIIGADREVDLSQGLDDLGLIRLAALASQGEQGENPARRSPRSPFP